MTRFPGEWEPQEFIQLTWPHSNTDWRDYLESAYACFIKIAEAISRFQKLLIVCKDSSICMKQLSHLDQSKILFFELDSNDTWARDHGGITVFKDNNPVIYDFQFNGWGQKFPATKDNIITKQLYNKKAFRNSTYMDFNDFVFEGGGIESNGNGILLTTSECLLSKNRNEKLSRQKIELKLLNWFGASKVLWLDSGYLAGDDTDSHIDTLARFANKNTILYVSPPEKGDEHYESLIKMESQLKAFTNLDGVPFNLIPLPFPPAVYNEEGERLPATYANFLFINNAVLVPIYNLVTDSEAISTFERTFPDKEIIGIDCSILIKQHGSLHCVTMQYPKGI